MKKIGLIVLSSLILSSTSFAGLCKITVSSGLAGSQLKDFTARDLSECTIEAANAHNIANTYNPRSYKKTVMKYYENSNYGDIRLSPDFTLIIRSDGSHTWKTSESRIEYN